MNHTEVSNNLIIFLVKFTPSPPPIRNELLELTNIYYILIKKKPQQHTYIHLTDVNFRESIKEEGSVPFIPVYITAIPVQYYNFI